MIAIAKLDAVALRERLDKHNDTHVYYPEEPCLVSDLYMPNDAEYIYWYNDMFFSSMHDIPVNHTVKCVTNYLTDNIVIIDILRS